MRPAQARQPCGRPTGTTAKSWAAAQAHVFTAAAGILTQSPLLRCCRPQEFPNLLLLSNSLMFGRCCLQEFPNGGTTNGAAWYPIYGSMQVRSAVLHGSRSAAMHCVACNRHIQIA